LHELVALAGRQSCTTLVTAPGMPSFNFWTGLSSPPQLGGGGCWVTGMKQADQELLVRQLSKESHVCVIFNLDRVEYCARGRVPSTPMVRFMLDQFRTEFQSGDYRFMVRD
jgi:hypothetical protein